MNGGEDTIFPLPGYAFWDVNRENLDFSRDKKVYYIPNV
jgi:hypothetical protein